MTLAATPGQTVGPFFAFALLYDGCSELVPPGAPRRGPAARAGARRRRRSGARRAGRAVAGGADGAVVRASPARCDRDGFTFTGWGVRPPTATAATRSRRWRPAPTTPGAAPFFAVTVFARGLLNRLFTRAYLPDHEQALAADPLLASLDAERASTLVAAAGRARLRLRHPAAGTRARPSSSAIRHAD